MEQQKRNFSVDPGEMIYHKDRFLAEGKCSMVRFVGAFHGDNVLTNEVEVICRGNDLGKIARFVVRYGDEESHLTMDLETCRYEAECNIQTKLGDVVIVFEATYQIEEVVPA